MNVEDFTYHLPEELIAAHPAAKREQSRLMILPAIPGAGPIHTHFQDIAERLQPDDLLVRNTSRVIPARLFAHRATGGLVEILLLEDVTGNSSIARWKGLVRPARKIHPGEHLIVAAGELEIDVIAEEDGGIRTLEFSGSLPFREALQRHGHMPLPPYILKRRAELEGTRSADKLHLAEDRDRYQTVYAKAEGSVAAPTAGLHFSEELFTHLLAKGVEVADVTLHVGAGTFQSMDEGGRVEDHKMHSETWEVPPETAALVNKAKAEGRRVIAVGTTSVRTLESAVDEETGLLRVGSGSTQLMITPGRKLRLVDALITNFHLPRSTLLLLVSALVGRRRLLAAYEAAIRHGYHFFSYGDAMLVEGITEDVEPVDPGDW